MTNQLSEVVLSLSDKYLTELNKPKSRKANFNFIN